MNRAFCFLATLAAAVGCEPPVARTPYRPESERPAASNGRYQPAIGDSFLSKDDPGNGVANVVDLVRRRVAETISNQASRIMVSSVAGRITLSGVVSTVDEKFRISRVAQDVAGPANVDDFIRVEP